MQQSIKLRVGVLEGPSLHPNLLLACSSPCCCCPISGYIVVLDYKGYANGELFEDTTARRKPIVFLYGKRPFSGGMCLGVEKALATMRAGEGWGEADACKWGVLGLCLGGETASLDGHDARR